MLILTNALAERVDEGCLKVANSLIKRLKKTVSDLYIVSFDRESDLADKYLPINKLLINKELIKIIRKRKEKVVYLPFPAKPIATAIRIFILTVFARWGVDVVITQQAKLDGLSRLLLKLCGASLVVFSKDSFRYYSEILGEHRVKYLKTGVDTEKFVPVPPKQAQQLRLKYGIALDKPVVLHVGHLKQGRNIGQLMKLGSEYQILLAVSTLTQDEQDTDLRKQLEACGNIRIIDDYLGDIQELYQLADVYFFPVVAQGNCIDVPLSCLEAAACSKPVVTTAYGEMKEFQNVEGFCFIDAFTGVRLNELVAEALNMRDADTRAAVMDYDWHRTVAQFTAK